jgi:hypothetical protein
LLPFSAAMPWFGVDVGGTLAKLVFFEPTDHNEFTVGTLDGLFNIFVFVHRETTIFCCCLLFEMFELTMFCF